VRLTTTLERTAVRSCPRAVQAVLSSSLLLWLLSGPRLALAQTPSPMQEWQYSGGIILANLFEPTPPKWRVTLGPAAQLQPLYDGAGSYHAEPGPLIDIRYRNFAYLSTGEGLGADLLRGTHYRAGVSIGYDLGRSVDQDSTHLHGLGDIAPAPVLKAYASIVVARVFPLVLRVDARRYVGGADGSVGDLEVYLPLPGSSRRFVMFAGPSITFGDQRYLQKEFGVTASQSLASGYRRFDPPAGEFAEGVGFSATGFITQRWLIDFEAAINRLQDGIRDSPIIQRRVQRMVTLSTAYMWTK